MADVKEFSGEYRFLSNFWEAPIEHDFGSWGILKMRTVEHGYQAMKAINKKDFLTILQLPTPSEAKKMGREVKVRKDWDKVKDNVMMRLVRAKFDGNSMLKDMLVATHPDMLIEGNEWGDTYWGVDKKYGGENMLGRILMAIRDDYVSEKQ